MEPVAIVGLSLRYPGLQGPAAFFDCCTTPKSRLGRFDSRQVYPYMQDHPRGRSHPYKINNDLYGSIQDISWIDVRQFRVPPSDIEGDPSPFICVQVASEALLDFQYGRATECIDRKRTGIVIGRGDHPHRGLWSGLQGGTGFELIRELLLERNDLFTEEQVDKLVATLLMRMKPFPNPSLASSLVSNVISGLVANRLDIQGPNSLVDAACTSAIVAVQQAVRSLSEHETDLMLVGAIQGTMSVQIIQMFSMLGAISYDDVQPFNPLVEGTLLSEGVGFVVLKRLHDARRDGDRIYSIIRGLGLASDGNDSAVLAPSSRGQVLAMQNTYNNVGDIAPDDIGFIEAHATGINLGDETELDSIIKVFNPSGRNRPLVLGTLKSLIGHSIPASGMAALIRASYAVSYGVYPASRCYNQNDRLKRITNGLFLPTKMGPWYESPGVPRRAAINCFGFGGINGHLLIEQDMRYDEQKLLVMSGLLCSTNPTDDQTDSISHNQNAKRSRVTTGSPVYILCLSFNNADELLILLQKAIEHCNLDSNWDSSCQMFTSDNIQAGHYRIGMCSRSITSIRDRLRSLLADPNKHHSVSTRVPYNVPELVVMLPGESQIPFGYLSELAQFMPSVKNLIEFVDQVCTTGIPLSDTIHPAWGSLLDEQAIQNLEKHANHHDSATRILFIVSVAYYGILRTLGLAPSALTGHSTGEINALMLAGGLQCNSASDVTLILKSFNDLYSDDSYLSQVREGTVVLAAGLGDESLAQCIQPGSELYLVSDNSPSHRLIFSPTKNIDEISKTIAEYGGFTLPTMLDRAYHTSFFYEGSELMRSFYENLSFSPLDMKVYSCCSAEQYPVGTDNQIDLLVRQWREPVRFRQVLKNMYRDGYRLFLELNAQRTLIGFAESTFHGVDDVELFSTGSVREDSAIDSMANAFVSLWQRGLDVQLDQWDSLFQYSPALSLLSVERPTSAVTIRHALHQLTSDDYQSAWSHVQVTESAPSPSEQGYLAERPHLTLSPKQAVNSRKDTPVAPRAYSEHQSIMRRVLQSLELNTTLLLGRLADPSK